MDKPKRVDKIRAHYETKFGKLMTHERITREARKALSSALKSKQK